MMLQVANSYYNILPNDSRELPVELGIGRTWLHPKIYGKILEHKDVSKMQGQDHYKVMCKNFREEYVTLVEKLRVLRLHNFITNLVIPDGFGVFKNTLHKNLVTAIKKVLFQLPKWKEVERNNLKEEKTMKKVLNN